MTKRVGPEATDRIADAGAWIARLEAADAEDAVAFDAWLEASDANQRAYDQAIAVCEAYDAAAPQVLAGLATLARQRAQAQQRAMLVVGGLAAACAVAAVSVGWLELSRPPPPRAYATGVGERTRVRLADGSTIDLDAGTELTVALGHDARRVTLRRGEAIFDVAHDAARPFLVAAGDRSIRVVGTRFDVRRRDGEVAVTVARGLVEVGPAGEAGGHAYRLHPGQRLAHREGASGVQIAATDPDEVFAWNEGRLVFRDAPLGAVIAELNLQVRRPIHLEDATLAEARVSGVLVLDDEDAVLRRLALLAPVAPIASGDGVQLRRVADR